MMRVWPLLVGVLAALPLAMASEKSRGVEMLFFYNVYRHELESLGSTGVYVGLGCNHPCNFDDFLRHVMRNPSHYPGSGGRIANVDNPTIAEVQDISAWPGGSPKGQAYDGYYDERKLLGPAYQPNMKHGDRIQVLAQRAKAAQAAKPNTARAAMIESCLRSVMHIRGQEYADGLINEVEKKIRNGLGRTVRAATHTITTPDGNSFRMIDTLQTLENLRSNNAPEALRQEIQELAENHELSSGRTHRAVLQHIQMSLSTYLNNGSGC